MAIRPILVKRVIPILFVTAMIGLPFSVVTGNPKLMIGFVAVIIVLAVAHESLGDDGRGPTPWPWL